MAREYVTHQIQMTVQDALVHYLELEQVDKVFGVPGGGLMNLLIAMKNHRSKVEYIICRQETGAAYIADGYHRMTDNLGVVMVTSGPGATNALTGTMNAQNSCSSLLTITGEVNEEYYGKGYLQEGIDTGLDIKAIYQAATKYSSVITDASDFQSLFSQALRDALSTPGRAVHVSMPNNVSKQTIDDIVLPSAPANYRATPSGADEQQIRCALEALTACKRPLILLGNGCRKVLRDPDTLQMLVNLAEYYGIPVMTTVDGKGIFPESHPLSLRAYGMADCTWPYYWLHAQEGEAPYDGLLVLGSSLGELSTNKWHPMLVPDGPFIQVDLCQEVIGRAFHVSHGIVGEVGSFIHQMSSLRRFFPPDAALVEQRKKLVAGIKEFRSPFANPEQYTSLDSPIQPAAMIRVLQETLPQTSAILIDAGNCVGWAAHYLRIDPPMEIHTALSMGPMGFGVGAVIGAKIGRPDMTCLAITGDGAFMMQGAEISTAKRYRVGAIWIVLYDDNLSMVSQGMDHFAADNEDPGIWHELYQLGSPDLEKYAQGLGAETYSVDSPQQLQQIMPDVLEGANERNVPQVVIVRINRDVVPPYYNPMYGLPKTPTRSVK